LEHRQLLSADSALSALSDITAHTNLQVLPLVSTGPSGYSPRQIETAYGVSAITFSGGTVAGTGAGQTIAIVDAYSDPNITADLAKFDAQYGLSAPPSFVVDNLAGMSTDAGWALETSLDVEWAHALAPQANIVLVEAASSSLGSLFSAVSYASNLAGVSVVSMSWGTQEFWGEAQFDSVFTHPGVTYIAASGDSGAWSGPEYPSVSPNVLAVGGTTLTLGANSAYASETGWSDSTGGFSGYDMNWWYYEPAPSYQVAAQAASGSSYGVRTTPDVSFNASPNTGVAVYDSVSYYGQSGWFEVGGTSAAAPAWAGLVAITDQGLAAAHKGSLTTAQLQTDLYSLPSSDFHDITSGFNGYSATPGYDLVTGLGSPRANLVIAGLLSASGASAGSPSKGSSTAGSTASNTGGKGAAHSVVPLSSSTIGLAVANASFVGSPQFIGALPPQTLNTQTSVSSVPCTPSSQQTSAATVLVQQSPTTQNTLGQSVPLQSRSNNGRTDRNLQQSWLIDQVEEAAASPPAPGQAQPKAAEPAPELNQNPNLDQNQEEEQEQEPPPAPLQPAAPGAILPVKPAILLDAALESMSHRSSTAPYLRWRTADPAERRQGSATSWQVSTLVGTAAIAAGGYRLALKETDRKRKSWLPGRNLYS